MRIVGVEVDAKDIEDLVQRLTDHGARETAQRLSRAARRGTREIALAEKDQQQLLATLDESAGALKELRTVLAKELEWRHHEVV